MKTYLLDANVWLASVDTDDSQHAAAAELLRSAERNEIQLARLDLALYEVANVAVVRWNNVAIANRLVGTMIGLCPERTAAADAALLDSAASIAERAGISVYDAAYAAAASKESWTLVSCDVRDLVSNQLAVTPDAALASRTQ